LIPLDQVVIFVAGAASVYLVNRPEPGVRRWGCICGLIAQPFWFYTSAVNGQWGVFAASFLYAYSWGQGLYFTWIRRVT
jgi:hypothetical protein